MGSLGKRRGRLEESYKDRLASADEEARDALFQDVLMLMSNEELEAYDRALERILVTGEPAVEDQGTLARVDRLYQEAERERSLMP